MESTKSWSGKVKTITSKDFQSVFGSGQYNIPEDATVFQSSDADCFWSIGGAKYKKPAHWNCSNFLVKTSLKSIGEDNFTLDGFQLINHSVSETSSFQKFAFHLQPQLSAPGIIWRDLQLMEKTWIVQEEIYSFQMRSV